MSIRNSPQFFRIQSENKRALDKTFLIVLLLQYEFSPQRWTPIPLVGFSEKYSTHPSARDPLSLMQNIVLVNELHEVIAAFLYTAHKGHKCRIVTLFIELRLESFRLQDRQASN